MTVFLKLLVKALAGLELAGGLLLLVVPASILLKSTAENPAGQPFLAIGLVMGLGLLYAGYLGLFRWSPRAVRWVIAWFGFMAVPSALTFLWKYTGDYAWARLLILLATFCLFRYLMELICQRLFPGELAKAQHP